MRLGLAQLTPRPREVSTNLARACELLGESEYLDLVVLPELFLSGYVTSDIEPVAVALDGPELGALRDAARHSSTAVIVGFAESTASGVANSAAFIDDSGELAGIYRKTHLFGAERDAYVSGDELHTVRLCGRTLGPMICFDVEFPEVARTLAALGADLLVTISANPAQFRLDHDVFVRARALENGLPHVYVNIAGDQEATRFGGNSIALDPDGKVLAEGGPEAECVVSAKVGAPGRSDHRTSYGAMLREPLYLHPQGVTSRNPAIGRGGSGDGDAARPE
jgi:predicted amidohydrolase